MLGTFQGATLRVEVEAQGETLRQCLVQAALLRRWVWPQQLDLDLPAHLEPGAQFTSRLGPITLRHRVEDLTTNRLQLVLWGAADGFSEWAWGNGWVQLRIEAISLLPLNLGQIILLRRLQEFATKQEGADKVTD